MKRPLSECPRYEKSTLLDGETKEPMVDCSACYFSIVYGRDCRVKRMTKKSQIAVKAISNPK